MKLQINEIKQSNNLHYFSFYTHPKDPFGGLLFRLGRKFLLNLNNYKMKSRWKKAVKNWY